MNLSCIVRSRYGFENVRVTLVDVMSSVECVVSEMCDWLSFREIESTISAIAATVAFTGIPGWPEEPTPFFTAPFTAFATPFATSEAPPVATARIPSPRSLQNDP